MTDMNLSPEAIAIIEKVQKLLALAGNNPNEHEAAAASSKAMELLNAYNLDMLIVERAQKTGSGKRSDTKLAGGLYKWQRSLWEEVSKLHFCMYWSIKGMTKGSSYEHRVLGRQENVIGTKVMAEYLQQTVERIAREWAGDPVRYFAKPTISFREGMATRLCERLAKLQREKMADGKRSASNGPPGTALVLADVAQSETDANYDHLYGQGWSARRRAAQAAADAEYVKQRAAAEAWQKANPEEYAQQQAEAARRSEEYWKKEARNAKRRKGVVRMGPSYKGDSDAYWAGRDRGDEISLNRQVDQNDTRRIR